MQKKLLSLALVLVLMFTVIVPAQAAQISPFYVNTGAISVDLQMNGTIANGEAWVSGKAGTTKITGTVYLKKVVNGTYTTIKTWTGLSSNSDILLFTGSYAVPRGQSYVLQITAKVTRNGTTETVNGSSGVNYCS